MFDDGEEFDPHEYEEADHECCICQAVYEGDDPASDGWEISPQGNLWCADCADDLDAGGADLDLAEW